MIFYQYSSRKLDFIKICRKTNILLEIMWSNHQMYLKLFLNTCSEEKKGKQFVITAK